MLWTGVGTSGVWLCTVCCLFLCLIFMCLVFLCLVFLCLVFLYLTVAHVQHTMNFIPRSHAWLYCLWWLKICNELCVYIFEFSVTVRVNIIHSWSTNSVYYSASLDIIPAVQCKYDEQSFRVLLYSTWSFKCYLNLYFSLLAVFFRFHVFYMMLNKTSVRLENCACNERLDVVL